MRKIIIAAVISLAVTGAQASFASNPKPEKCPGVSALKNSVFKLVNKDATHVTWQTWTPYGKYDTKDTWEFSVTGIQAKDEVEAKALGQKSLESLRFDSGPIYAMWFDGWLCYYADEEGYSVIAINPSVSDPNVAFKARK